VLTYALADQITITNENQPSFMLNHFPDEALADQAARHSVISRNPRPDPSSYAMIDSGYDLPGDKVHLAYCGVFSAAHELTEVWRALERLRSEDRERVLLHVVTSEPNDLAGELAAAGLTDVVRANPHVSYLEYLNLAARSDVLIMNDANTPGIHDVYPYLPSMWSDYAGSGSAVWGIVKSGSVLSGQPLDHRSELGEVDGVLAVLTKIVYDHHV
jgi:hypothetical protein